MKPEFGISSNVAQVIAQPRAGVELAVIVPTYNERENVTALFHCLETVLREINWEVVFVDDDSPDGTAGEVYALSQLYPNVRALRRIGRKGLASACIEGMLSTAAPYIAVMDADLQHDERILPAMLTRMKQEQLDLVVASRNVEGGSMGEFTAARVRLSNLGSKFSRMVARCDLSDPMSGFFVVNRQFLEQVVYRLSGIGFKILLDIVCSSRRPVRFAEVPFTFRTRQFGASKLDINVGLEYFYLLLDKIIGEWIPPRFVVYALVGGVGVVLHVCMLGVFYAWLGMPFGRAQTIATAVVVLLNFLLNNAVTFRDRRLRGAALGRGLVIYGAACSIGFVTNLSVADFANKAGVPWFVAGAAGLSISAVWNYAVSNVFTWRRKRA